MKKLKQSVCNKTSFLAQAQGVALAGVTIETQKKLAKIFILTDLLIQEIDDPTRTPTKESKAIQDKAKELQKMLEPVLDRFYDNKSVKESTFFQTMQNKFNYIFDKEYKT